MGCAITFESAELLDIVSSKFPTNTLSWLKNRWSHVKMLIVRLLPAAFINATSFHQFL